MANPYAPGPLAGGGEALLGALLGGGQAEQAGHDREYSRLLGVQSQEAGLDKKITDALMERDLRKNKLAIPGAIDGAMPQVPPEVRALMSALVGAEQGADIQRVQQGAIRAQLPAMREEEGFSPANALASAYAPKPIENVKVQGGHILSALFGESPVVQATGETQSKIAENNAQAGAHEAREWRTRAQPFSTGSGRSGRGRGRGRPTLADMPPGEARPTAEDTERLLRDPKMYGSSFIRKFGTDAYEAALDYREKFLEAKKMKPGETVPAAPRDPKKRTAGTLYNTPKGVLRWTSKGWTDK